MKKTVIGFIAIFCCTTLFAQSNKEDIQLIQAMYGKEKKALVSEYMALDSAKSSKFWTLYDEYESDRKTLGAERLNLLESYANNYATLDDKKALEITSKLIELNGRYIKFQQKYLKKFSDGLGGLQAAKFFQLENYLETAIRLTLQDELPAIADLEEERKEINRQQ